MTGGETWGLGSGDFGSGGFGSVFVGFVGFAAGFVAGFVVGFVAGFGGFAVIGSVGSFVSTTTLASGTIGVVDRISFCGAVGGLAVGLGSAVDGVRVASTTAMPAPVSATATPPITQPRRRGPFATGAGSYVTTI